MITIRAGHQDLNRVAELLGVEGGDVRIRRISEEHGVVLEFNAAPQAGSPLWRKLLPSASIQLHHLESNDQKLHFDLRELTVAGRIMPDWTVKMGMKLFESKRVQQWVNQGDHPFEVNSAARVALMLDKLKQQLKLPFDFKVGEIAFADDEISVRLTIDPLPDQKGM